MSFTDLRYPAFLAAVFAGYWSLRSRRARRAWLLAASAFFYAAWNWRFLPLLGGLIVVDFLAGREIARSSAPGRRRGFLLLSLGANLLMLGVFKYYDFFVASAALLLTRLGFQVRPALLEVAVPLGISFHTFQAMSYNIDVYRGEQEPVGSLLDFALFVAFFPQLAAGPIVRARQFFPELESPKRFQPPEARRWLALFLIGFFKKACVADRLAPLIGALYARPGAYSSSAARAAAALFTIQLYCDFSGYTDMARASAGLLGFELPENFDHPFLATSVQQFWRRWNKTMTDWFRDYVYIPLGGNRGGALLTLRNLLITAALAGLWHGSGAQFLAFGLVMGLSLTAHRLLVWARGRGPSNRARGAEAAVGMAATFAAVSAGFVFFRAPDVATGWLVLRRCFSAAPGWSLPTARLLWPLGALACAHYASAKRRLEQVLADAPEPLFYAGFGLALGLCLALAAVTYRPFIYAAF